MGRLSIRRTDVYPAVAYDAGAMAGGTLEEVKAAEDERDRAETFTVGEANPNPNPNPNANPKPCAPTPTPALPLTPTR